jgi:exosome complex RNA-binding protein Csl4
MTILNENKIETAENTAGVIPSFIYNNYVTVGSEIIGDLVILGQASYNAKIKSVKLTSNITTGSSPAAVAASVVLLDRDNNISATLGTVAALASQNRTELTTAAQNIKTLNELAASDGYQNNYKIALKFNTATDTANKYVYAEVVTIDNV